MAALVAGTSACLAEAPPELAQDAIFEGLHLVGGGSLLDGYAQLLSESTSVPVQVAPDPARVVIEGATRCLDDLVRLRLAVGGGEHEWEASGVTECPERGHDLLMDQRIRVGVGPCEDRREGAEGGPIAERHQGSDRHVRLGIKAGDEGRDHLVGDRDRQLGRSDPHRWHRVGEGDDHGGAAEPALARQGAEGRDSDPRIVRVHGRVDERERSRSHLGPCQQHLLAVREIGRGRYGVVTVSHPGSMPPPKDLGSARRTVRVALVVLVVVILVGFVASRIDLHEYAMTPGGAQPVGPLISIDGAKPADTGGHILLTDVLLTPLNLLTWLPAHFGTATEIIPEDALVPSGEDPADLDAQGYLDMAQSKDAARTAALRRLGYHVTATDDGALVTAVGTDTPAAEQLHVADVIVGVNGAPVTTSCDLISAIHDDPPGTTVALQVRPAKISDSGAITNGPATTVKVALKASHEHGRTASHCPGVTGPSHALLGVAVETDRTWHYPFSISISTPNIGGPSAGLAMTLGIIDSLSHGHLLRSSTIAATGTMAPSGAVGDVGGVEQKAVAVSRARASVFLVPGNEGPTARKTASAGLKVVPVTSLDQALRLLLARGGSITMADGSVETRANAAAAS